jgi:hypothetical protein
VHPKSMLSPSALRHGEETALRYKIVCINYTQFMYWSFVTLLQ